jgi:hypothetical protein
VLYTKRYSELGSFFIFLVWAFFIWLSFFPVVSYEGLGCPSKKNYEGLGAMGPYVLDVVARLPIKEMFISIRKKESRKCKDAQLKNKNQTQTHSRNSFSY